MVKIMRSHRKNGNGHFGLEFFKRLWVGFYYYPASREVTFSVMLPKRTPDPKTGGQ